MRKFFLLIILFTSIAVSGSAQHLKADFCGAYECPASLYERFEFYGNGKVSIGASLTDVLRDFFQYGDTLVVYPDKSAFRFKVQPDGSLKGISDWVTDSVWKKVKPDTIQCGPAVVPAADKLQQMYAYEKVLLLSGSTTRTEADNDQIMATLEKLCTEGYGKACNSLGMLYLFTRGSEQGLAIWEKGCALNDANCCKNIADEYKEKKNLAKAKIYYERACALGDFGACNWDFEERLKKMSAPAKKPVKKKTAPPRKK
jgi:TPR repeat protein